MSEAREQQSGAQAVRHPLVTIGILVCNGEDYLERALFDALAQTYPNIELTLSNN